MERYAFIIGNAWGMINPASPPMHYWIYQGEGAWESACGIGWDYNIKKWSDVPSIDVHYADGEEICQECLEVYLDTDYGKKHGVKAPYANEPTQED